MQDKRAKSSISPLFVLKNAFPIKKAVKKIIVPIILKDKWATATFLALEFTPILEIIAVIQIPIFCPIMIGKAAPQEISTFKAKAWSIPTDADELWIIAVSSAPIKIPKNGLLNY